MGSDDTMNTAAITDALLRNYSRAGFLALRDRIGGSAERFAGLIALLKTPDRRLALRASWLMTMCAETRPKLLVPHLSALFAAAERSGAEQGIQRNILRSLQFLDVPVRFQGRAVELSFRLLREKRSAVAVKVFAMSVLANIAGQQPDLKEEIALTIEQMMPYGSAGIRSRGRRLLSRLRK